MTAESAIAHTRGPERIVGHVYADLRILNAGDLILARRGVMPAADVRSIDLTYVLVDTGASHLCLPAHMVSELGLEFVDDAQVLTANGVRTSRLFTNARLEVEGRTDLFSVLELPDDAQPLLGVIPLEALGLEPDLVQRRLRVLPRSGHQTHLLAL